MGVIGLRRWRAALAAAVVAAAVAGGTAMPAVAATGGPTRLAIAVPLTAPPSRDGLIDADALELYTGEGGLLDRQLDALAGRQVAIGVDPRIIASVRVLGASAPPAAIAWLQRLELLPNETFALAYADADLTVTTQAGAAVAPEPAGFGFAIDPADFAPPVTATPAPTPDPALPSAPEDDDATTWLHTVDGLAWPREDTVVATDLAALAASGYGSAIISSDNLDVAPGRATATVDGMPVAVSDATLSQQLTLAVENPGVDPSVLLGSIAATGDEGAVLATLARATPINADRLAAVLDAIAGDPGVDLVPLSQVLAQPAAAASVVDRPQDPDRVATAAELLQSDAATDRFAAIAADPSLLVEPSRLRMLTLLSNGWLANPSGWGAATAAQLDAATETRRSVRYVGSSSINLSADQTTTLPIPIENGIDQAVTVYVTVRPTTGRLSVGQQRVEVVVPAQAQASAQVPVQAIANGRVTVQVTVTAADGLELGGTRFLQMNVQAGWETPVVIVFAVVVVLVFASGIVRTVLRRRRQRGSE